MQIFNLGGELGQQGRTDITGTHKSERKGFGRQVETGMGGTQRPGRNLR